MKKRPIIFSSKMVRSILDGRKTLTRRVVKWPVSTSDHGASHSPMVMRKGIWWKPKEICPYGQPGDRLWVKETWKIGSFMEGDPIEFQYRADGKEAPENVDYTDSLTYNDWNERIDIQSTDYLIKINWPNKNEDGVFLWDRGCSPLPWHPSIFMPRWASRITLEVMKVRVERLQDITLEDVAAEGIGRYTFAKGVLSETPPDPRWKFIELWDAINAKRGFGWEVNPWVWVVEFRRLEEA
jgi:hypothetical protein